MMAFVTGASGFLGHALTRRLLEARVNVIASVGPVQHPLEAQRVSDLERWGVRIHRADLSRELRPDELPADEDWDTLFHLAAFVQTEVDSPNVRVNDLGTARLLDKLNLANKRVIFSSTIAVADNAPGGKVTLETSCQPRTAYGRTKLRAEEIVRNECSRAGATYTIIRVPTLYGVGYRQGGMFDVLPDRLRTNAPLARLAWPGRLALLAVDDMAELLYRAACSPDTGNRTFLASSNENPRTHEIIEGIAAAIGVDYRSIPLASPAARILRTLVGDWWQAQVLPHAIRTNTWRARLLLDGLYCDGSELTRLVGMTYRDWRRGLAKMYAESADRLRSNDAPNYRVSCCSGN